MSARRRPGLRFAGRKDVRQADTEPTRTSAPDGAAKGPQPVDPAVEPAATPDPAPSAERTLYDRYRDALRGGHLAGLRGNRAVAARAYLEAAALLPDRAAPYIGLGKAELVADRPAEALAAFESALQRAPSDTGALEGAARALGQLDRRVEAADMLDRLAITLLEHDRQTEALATIERALDLAESRWRRSALERLRAGQGATDSSWLGDLPSTDRERIAGAQVAELSAGRTDLVPVSDELRRIAQDVERASADEDVPGLLQGALALARHDRLRAAIDACHDALSVAPADPDVHRTLAAVYRRRGWQGAAQIKLRLVDRLLEVVDDPEELDRLAEAAEDAGDVVGMLAVVERHAGRRRHATALELAFRALELAPADPGVHLAIAHLHLLLGWRRRALDEVTRLARLTELTDDAPGRELVAAFVNTELRVLSDGTQLPR